MTRGRKAYDHVDLIGKTIVYRRKKRIVTEKMDMGPYLKCALLTEPTDIVPLEIWDVRRRVKLAQELARAPGILP